MEITYPYWIFYINTDWGKDLMGTEILQKYGSLEARNTEAQEKASGKCEFNKSLEGMRLWPIFLILISTVSPLENSRQNVLGEAAAVRWAMGKFRNYLWGTEFTVLSNCSGLQKFFKSEANVPHVVYRRKPKFLK